MEGEGYINVNSSFDYTLSKERLEEVIKWHKVRKIKGNKENEKYGTEDI